MTRFRNAEVTAWTYSCQRAYPRIRTLSSHLLRSRQKINDNLQGPSPIGVEGDTSQLWRGVLEEHRALVIVHVLYQLLAKEVGARVCLQGQMLLKSRAQ